MLARSLSRVVSLRVRVANRIMVSSLGLPSLHARKFPTAHVDASILLKKAAVASSRVGRRRGIYFAGRVTPG